MTENIYDNPEKLIELFHHINSASIDAMRQAEQTIRKLNEEDPVRFAFSLIDNLITSENATISDTVKQCALLVLKNTLKLKGNHEDCPITPEKRNLIRQRILPLMFSNIITDRQMSIAQGVLKVFYQQPLSPQDVQVDIVNIKHQIALNDSRTYRGITLTLQSLFKLNPETKKKISEQFQELIIWLIDLGNQETQALMTDIRLSKSENFDSKVQFLNLWFKTVIEFVESDFLRKDLLKKPVSMLQNKTYYQKLPTILQNLLSLNLSSNHNHIHALVAKSSQCALNELKADVFNLLFMVLDALESFKSKIDLTTFTFFQIIQNEILKSTINGLISFLNSQEYYEIFEDGSFEDNIQRLFKEAFVFLGIATKFKPLCLVLQQYSISDLLIYVFLPLMRTVQFDQEMYNETPSEFINTIEDICFLQRSSEIKSQIAALISTLASNNEENNNGILALRLLLSIIEHSISNDQVQELTPKSRDSLFVSNVEAESQIETCLLAISCLTNIATDSMKKIISEFLSRHYSYFIDSPTISIKTSFCLLIACYPESVFQFLDNHDLSENYLRFILESVNIKDKEAGCLIEMANFTLEKIFEKESLSTFLAPYTADVVKVLFGILRDEDKQSIRRVLIEIITKHELQFEELPYLLLDVIRASLQKIQKSLQDEMSSEEELDIGSTLLHLEKLFQKEKYMRMIQKELEEVMQPIISFLEDFGPGTVDDQYKHEIVLNLLTSLLPVLKNLTEPLTSNILRSIPEALKNYMDHEFIYLTVALNNILTKIDVKNSEIIKSLVKVSLLVVNQKNVYDKERVVCQGALLLQTIFKSIMTLTDQQFEEILVVTNKQLQKAKNPFVKVQLLCVFLEAFRANYEVTQAILSKHTALDSFVNLLQKNVLTFGDNSYSQQVLIVGLNDMLFLNHTKLSEEIKARSSELFNILVSFLQFQKTSAQAKEESKIDEDARETQKTLLKDLLGTATTEEEEIESTEKDEDEDEDDIQSKEDEEWEEESEEEDYEFSEELVEELTEQFLKKIDDEKILETFKIGFCTLKQNNSELLQTLVEGISTEKREFLEKLSI